MYIVFAILGLIFALVSINLIIKSMKAKTSMKSGLLSLAIAFGFLIISFIVLPKELSPEKANMLAESLNAVDTYTYENDYGKFIKVEMAVTDIEEVYNRCKTSFPILVQQGIQQIDPDIQQFTIIATIRDGNTGEKLDSQAISVPFAIMDKINWQKATNFDNLLIEVTSLASKVGL